MSDERHHDAATEADVFDPRTEPGVSGRVYLVVRRGSDSRVIDLEPGMEVTIGRAPESTILIDDTRASRNHARIRRTERGIEVTDLGSRNGTRTNRRVLVDASASLIGGDVVWVASTEIVVAASSIESDVNPNAPEDSLVVADQAMVEVFEIARRLAQAPTTVLIVGETGVGKEVVAAHIHRSSSRAAAPFVRVNCASLPENLVESEFFGYEKGAFTGADRRKTGLIEAAQGGTLLLDEIGEIPLASQAKLLRVLETHTLTRLGATKEVPVDVRVLCATHRDLQEEVKNGRFRQDLYYRISAFTLSVPPLRERPLEVGLLARLFVRRIAEQMRAPVSELSEAVENAILEYAWPGNVRELRNAMEHAVIMANGAPIEVRHLPAAVRQAPTQTSAGPRQLRSELDEIEKKQIEEALALHGGNQTRAAEHLGISRRALVYKIGKYGLR